MTEMVPYDRSLPAVPSCGDTPAPASSDTYGFVDYYHVLGVSPAATDAEIERAHRAAAQRSHPDVGGSSEAFDRVRVARDVLLNPTARRLFDAERLLAAHRMRPTPATGPRWRRRWALDARRRYLRSHIARMLVPASLFPDVPLRVKDETALNSEERARRTQQRLAQEAAATARRQAYLAQLEGQVDEAERLFDRARAADRGR